MIHAIYSLIYVFSLLWCMAYLPAAIDCVRHGAKAQGAKKTKLSRKKNSAVHSTVHNVFFFFAQHGALWLEPPWGRITFPHVFQPLTYVLNRNSWRIVQLTFQPFSFCASGVAPEGNLTRQGAPCSMQQVWEELTGKHGCNTGDQCTQGTESHLHNKQYTMTTASGNWRKLG